MVAIPMIPRFFFFKLLPSSLFLFSSSLSFISVKMVASHVEAEMDHRFGWLGWMATAATSWCTRRYEACQEQLQQLLNPEAEGDGKGEVPIRLNMAICDYALADAGKREEATKTLLSSVSGVVTTAAGSGSGGGGGGGGGEASTNGSNAAIDAALAAPTPETFAACYNYAALLYKYHQFDGCRQVLERLVNFLDVEPQDSAASVKVCFLLLEVLLRLWQNDSAVAHTDEQLGTFHSQAFHTLSAAEKYLLQTFPDGRVGPPMSSPSNALHTSPSTASAIDPGALEYAAEPPKLLGNVLMYRAMLYRCRVHLAVGNVRDAEAEVARALELFERLVGPAMDTEDWNALAEAAAAAAAAASAPAADGGGTPGAAEAPSFIRLAALASYIGGADQLSAPHGPTLKAHLKQQHSMGSLLKAEVDFRLGDVGERAADAPLSPTGQPGEFMNNVACTLLSRKRYHAAHFYAQKAVDLLRDSDAAAHAHATVAGDAPPDVTSLRVSHPSDVLYNAGLCLLRTGNAEGAFAYLEKTLPEFHSRPVLWVRMAECCVQHHLAAVPPKAKDAGGANGSGSAPGVAGRAGARLSVAAGVHGRARRFVVDLGAAEAVAAADGAATPTPPDDAGTCGGCSLSRAPQYLNNALFLIRAAQAGGKSAVNREGGSPVPHGANGDSLVDSNHGHGSSAGMNTLEATALLQLAYVQLLLHNPLAALGAAKEVLAHQTLVAAAGAGGKAVAEMYAAEALCAVGRVDEALALLAPHPEPGPAGTLTEAHVPDSWFANPSVDSPRAQPPGAGRGADEVTRRLREAVATVNHAAALALQSGSGAGSLNKAQALLEPVVAALPGFLPATRLMLYIVLRRGNSERALALMRRNEYTA